MKFYSKIAFLISLFFNSLTPGQYNGYNFSVTGSYIYTTTSKLYLNPKATDEFIRGIHSSLDNIPGFSIEIRAKVAEYFFIGLSADYLKKTDMISSVSLYSPYIRNVTVEDGFRIIPVELTAYYVFPFSLKDYKFFMGGGGGFYFGSHIRTVGDITSSTESRETAFGIHVVAGVDFLVTENLSLRGTVKFRDMEIMMYNKYDKTTGRYNGDPIQLETPGFDSKVVVDGLVFNIGLSFHF